jgi:hypothetical protein
MVTIPPDLLDDVRDLLYAHLDRIGRELFYAGEGPISERDPAQYAGIFERLDKVRSLLDMTGWAGGLDAPTEVKVDLDEYGTVLEVAVERALRIDRDVFREIDRVDAERARRGEAPIREAVTARLNALQVFLATVRPADQTS